MKKLHYLILGLFMFTAIAIYAWNEYNRAPINVSDVEAKIEISSVDLIDQFQSNIELESKKYANTITQIDGKISAIHLEDSTITIDDKIRCEIDTESKFDLADLKIKDSIILKGFFGGYDDLMEEILFVRCKVNNNK